MACTPNHVHIIVAYLLFYISVTFILSFLFYFKVGVSASLSCTPSCLINPCQNGGSRKPLFPTDFKTPRFECHCQPGFGGNLCQHKVKSCRGYNNSSRIPGIYKIFDNNMNLLDVFCDFHLNSTNAWTLVQSYQLRNKNSFVNSPFTDDFTVNATMPHWNAYRLSKFRMQSIQEDSSKFRFTCNYNTDGVVYRDYLQVATDQVNILTFVGESCILLERIDIRGQSCENCTAFIVQGGQWNLALHCDSYYSRVRNCEFQPTGSLPCKKNIGEDDFGVYGCANSAHKCSFSQSSTTQSWFGGH